MILRPSFPRRLPVAEGCAIALSALTSGAHWSSFRQQLPVQRDKPLPILGAISTLKSVKWSPHASSVKQIITGGRRLQAAAIPELQSNHLRSTQSYIVSPKGAENDYSTWPPKHEPKRRTSFHQEPPVPLPLGHELTLCLMFLPLDPDINVFGRSKTSSTEPLTAHYHIVGLLRMVAVNFQEYNCLPTYTLCNLLWRLMVYSRVTTSLVLLFPFSTMAASSCRPLGFGLCGSPKNQQRKRTSELPFPPFHPEARCAVQRNRFALIIGGLHPDRPLRSPKRRCMLSSVSRARSQDSW